MDWEQSLDRNEAMQTLNELLDKDPVYVQTWLEDVWQSHREMLQGFNWYGLAQGAASKARSTLSLQWGQVALSIYEYLSSKLTSSERESLLSSAISLRAYLIDRLGPIL